MTKIPIQQSNRSNQSVIKLDKAGHDLIREKLLSELPVDRATLHECAGVKEIMESALLAANKTRGNLAHLMISHPDGRGRFKENTVGKYLDALISHNAIAEPNNGILRSSHRIQNISDNFLNITVSSLRQVLEDAGYRQGSKTFPVFLNKLDSRASEDAERYTQRMKWFAKRLPELGIKADKMDAPEDISQLFEPYGVSLAGMKRYVEAPPVNGWSHFITKLTDEKAEKLAALVLDLQKRHSRMVLDGNSMPQPYKQSTMPPFMKELAKAGGVAPSGPGRHWIHAVSEIMKKHQVTTDMLVEKVRQHPLATDYEISAAGVMAQGMSSLEPAIVAKVIGDALSELICANKETGTNLTDPKKQDHIEVKEGDYTITADLKKKGWQVLVQSQAQAQSQPARYGLALQDNGEIQTSIGKIQSIVKRFVNSPNELEREIMQLSRDLNKGSAARPGSYPRH